MNDGTAVRRILGVTTAILVTMGVVSGCGGDDSGTSGSGGYCGDLQTAKDSFLGLLDNQIGQDTFEQLRESLHTLTAEAPAAVKDEWTTFSTAVDKFAAAMDKAGLTMDDMRDMGTGQMSGGTDMKTAMDAAAALGAASVSTAQSRIAAHALKACKVDLNSG